MGRGANERDGLTPWGLELVQRLNDAGIVVDVSHVNQPGVLDACRTTRAPLMATHSGVSSINRHTRLLCDDAIDGIAATGGLIGVIFAPHFLCGRMDASSEVVADHLDWIKARVGVQHVAIGSDFDGWLPRIPSDMKDCRDIVKLVARLQQRGWNESDLFALLRGNVARVVRAVATAKAT
jgi:membrane dipeptidase